MPAAVQHQAAAVHLHAPLQAPCSLHAAAQNIVVASPCRQPNSIFSFPKILLPSVFFLNTCLYQFLSSLSDRLFFKASSMHAWRSLMSPFQSCALTAQKWFFARACCNIYTAAFRSAKAMSRCLAFEAKSHRSRACRSSSSRRKATKYSEELRATREQGDSAMLQL